MMVMMMMVMAITITITIMARASLSSAFLPCWNVEFGKNKSPEPLLENER